MIENAQGTLEDNDIFDNAIAGVWVNTGGYPTLRRNRITKNAVAIRGYTNGQGIYEENDLRGNTCGAWDISPEAQST